MSCVGWNLSLWCSLLTHMILECMLSWAFQASWWPVAFATYASATWCLEDPDLRIFSYHLFLEILTSWCQCFLSCLVCFALMAFGLLDGFLCSLNRLFILFFDLLCFLLLLLLLLVRFASVASHTSPSIASDCLLAILLMQVHDSSLLLLAPCSWPHSNHSDFHSGRPDSSWLVWSHPPGWSLLILLPFSCIPAIPSSMYLHICNGACLLLPPWSQAMSNGDWHCWG